MWIAELGQIGRLGEPSTATLGKADLPSRSAAEEWAITQLTQRGVNARTAAMMAAAASYGWLDDVPTRSSIRIVER